MLNHTDKLLQTDPMFLSFQKFSDGGDLTALQVDELLKKTLAEIEDKRYMSEVLDFSPADKNQEREESQPSNQCSVISGLEMRLTSEETRLLDHLVSNQVTACRDCMPVR